MLTKGCVRRVGKKEAASTPSLGGVPFIQAKTDSAHLRRGAQTTKREKKKRGVQQKE